MEYLSDKVTQVLDDYGILYGDIVENGDGTVNIVGVDEEEFDDVISAIEDELGLEVTIIPYDEGDELRVYPEKEEKGATKWALIINGEWFSTHDTYMDASNAALKFQSAIDNEDDARDEYGAFAEITIRPIKEGLKENINEDKEEDKLETFEDKMDFLAKDEQEAIDGYDKVMGMLDAEADAFVIEQLTKIKVEEEAHKKYLEDVKGNHELEYTEPLEQEEVKEDKIKEKIFIRGEGEIKEGDFIIFNTEDEELSDWKDAHPSDHGYEVIRVDREDDGSLTGMYWIKDCPYALDHNEDQVEKIANECLHEDSEEHKVEIYYKDGNVDNIMCKDYDEACAKYDEAKARLGQDVVKVCRYGNDECMEVDEIEESLKEAQQGFVTFLNLECGVLLPEDHPEFKDYAVAYDHKHGYYDETYLNALEGDLEQLKEGGLNYIKDGVNGTYAILTKIDVQGSMEDDYIQDAIKDIEDGMYIDNSIDFLDNEQFKASNVIWSAYKDENGEIIENFVDTSVSEEIKKELKEYNLDKDAKPYKTCGDVEYYIATFDDADRAMMGNKATHTIVTKKVGGDFGMGSGSGLDFNSEEEAKKWIDDACKLKVKEDLEPSIEDKLYDLLQEGNVFFDIAKDKDGDDFLIVDGWEDVHKIQKALKPDFEPKDDYDTSVLDEIFGYQGDNWGFRDEYSKCDLCGKVIQTEPDSYSWVPDFFIDYENGEIICGDCVRENPKAYLETLYNNPEKANTILSAIELQDEGFERIDGDFESGWYDKHDDPETILNKALEAHPNGVFIFHISGQGQFATQFELWGADLDVDESKKNESLWGDYKEYNPEDGWTEEDIAKHKAISSDEWKANNYEMDDGDEFKGEVTIYRWGQEPETKEVTFHKFLRANAVYPPYYKPIDFDVKGVVGPMYDGNKHGSYDIHDRYEDQRTYDILSEDYKEKDIIEFEDDAPMTFGEIVDMMADELRSGALDDESYTCTLSDEELEKLAIQYASEYIQDRKGHKVKKEAKR